MHMAHQERGEGKRWEGSKPVSGQIEGEQCRADCRRGWAAAAPAMAARATPPCRAVRVGRATPCRGARLRRGGGREGRCHLVHVAATACKELA